MIRLADKSLYRKIWVIALPMMLASVSEPLLGAVDTAVVGHLPDPKHLGAVAVGAMLFSYVFWAFGFLKMATGGFSAQAFGKSDGDELRAVLGRALLIAAGISLAMILLQRPILAFALPLIGAAEDVSQLADVYFSIRIWSTPAALANYVFFGWLLGMQNARANLIITLALNILNIGLDLLFVVQFEWGVAGVAWATVTASYIAALIGWFFVARGLRQYPGKWSFPALLNAAKHRRLFSTNSDLFIRTLCLVSCWAVFTSVSAQMGTVILAANAVLMTFMQIMAYALDGFANAAQAVAGAAYGAGDRQRFDDAVRAAGHWSIIFGLLIGAVFMLFGGLMIDLMTGLPEVRELAKHYLPWLALLTTISTWAFLYDGVFLGATETLPLRNTSAFCLVVFLIALFAGTHFFGPDAMWPAILLLNLLRGLTLHLSYPRLLNSIAPPTATPST